MYISIDPWPIDLNLTYSYPSFIILLVSRGGYSRWYLCVDVAVYRGERVFPTWLCDYWRHSNSSSSSSASTIVLSEESLTRPPEEVFDIVGKLGEGWANLTYLLNFHFRVIQMCEHVP